MKASTPQVKENICTDPNKPLYPAIKVDSDFWFGWLKEPDVKSFHFENDQGKFTARKEGRDTSRNEYWYAYRKFQGKLRKVYLGAMAELTSERLNQVATEISQPELEYRAKRESYTTKKEKSWVTGVEELTPTITSDSYPSESNPNWVTNDSELQALKLELDQVRSQQELEINQLRLQLEQFKALEKNATEQLCKCHSDAFKAADILKAALKLKSNAGGAIKREIEKALPLIDDV